MSRGKFTLSIAMIACALLIAGCGDDDKTTAAAGATAATGATGADGDKKSSDSKSEKSDSKKKSSKSDDESGSGGSSKSKSNSNSKSKSQSQSDSKSKGTPGVYKPPASTERRVRDATVAMGDAIRKKNADYLCNEAYSAEYLETLGGKSKCLSKVSQQISRYESYDMDIRGINFLDPKTAQSYLKLSFTIDGKKTESEPAISFKLEGGDWKYFIYTGDQ